MDDDLISIGHLCGHTWGYFAPLVATEEKRAALAEEDCPDCQDREREAVRAGYCAGLLKAAVACVEVAVGYERDPANRAHTEVRYRSSLMAQAAKDCEARIRALLDRVTHGD